MATKKSNPGKPGGVELREEELERVQGSKFGDVTLKKVVGFDGKGNDVVTEEVFFAREPKAHL